MSHNQAQSRWSWLDRSVTGTPDAMDCHKQTTKHNKGCVHSTLLFPPHSAGTGSASCSESGWRVFFYASSCTGAGCTWPSSWWDDDIPILLTY